MTSEKEHVVRFIDSGAPRHTLGLVYGRRRIGKSTLLEALAVERSGFYWEATRTEPAVHLVRLGAALGQHLGVGRLALGTWEEAFQALLRLGEEAAVPVVLDEFGHVIEADPSVSSVLVSALGPAGQRRSQGRTRLILCGSAIAMMRSLTAGEAPLRGRAGMELMMQPADFRRAREWTPRGGLDLAARLYAVIGGVVGYATDMVDYDLPANLDDFARWVCARVLSPASTLHHESVTLMAEDPTLSAAASPVLHHAILGAIANGSVTAGGIANRLGRKVSNLDPALKRLIAAGFVVRHEDPVRAQRPTYSLGDPFLQFHYAVLEPHGPLLRERDPRSSWEGHLRATFDSRVRGPVFEEQARTWVRRFASTESLGAIPTYLGPSAAIVEGKERQLDVVAAVAARAEDAPGSRTVVSLGEAKAGATVDPGNLNLLEKARASLGARAASAKLLLFAPAFDQRLIATASRRSDVELIDFDRLYHGS